MIHEQEKLELLSQQIEISNNILENKLLSRKWIWDNIFQFNKNEQKEMFENMVEDQKTKFRFEQIESEGNDPAQSGEKAGDDEQLEIARRTDWGGDRRSGTEEKEYGNEYDSDDLKDATSYHRERNGKREFKGKSPLATSKGGTLVAREGLLNSLQKKFGKDLKNTSLLSEETILDE